MIEYSQFNSENGMILQFGLCQDEVFPLMENVIEGVYDDSFYYVANYLPIERPKLNLSALTIKADGVETVTAIDLPIPFVIAIDGDEYEITDGSFEFTTTIPGEYRIQAKTFPYTDKTFTITAI